MSEIHTGRTRDAFENVATVRRRAKERYKGRGDDEGAKERLPRFVGLEGGGRTGLAGSVANASRTHGLARARGSVFIRDAYTGAEENEKKTYLFSAKLAPI